MGCVQPNSSYVMYRKALLFGGLEAGQYMLGAKPFDSLKRHGRNLNVDDNIWNNNHGDIMFQGNVLKFSRPVDMDAGEKILAKLLATGDKELVHASRDRILGVGFGASTAHKSRKMWGVNLLGEALMKVRAELRLKNAGKQEAPVVV